MPKTTPRTPALKLVPLKVEDYLARKHVRGVPLSQELFVADMLNRALIALVQERGDQVDGFMNRLLDDVAVSSQHFSKVDLDAATHKAFADCVAQRNPIAALSLLRQARLEQLMKRHVDSHYPDLAAATLEEVTDHAAPTLTIVTTANGEAVKDTARKIYQLNEKQMADFAVTFHWYFNEYLNTPYAFQTGNALAARLILAKGFSLKAMGKLMEDKLCDDTAKFRRVCAMLDGERQDYLQRQVQCTFIELTGFHGGQYGMDEMQAIKFSTRDREIRQAS